MKLRFRITVIVMTATIALAGLLETLDSPAFYAWQQERMVKRVLAANPQELLAAGRTMIANRPGFTGQINPASRNIPKAIRQLKPTCISVSTISLGIDFSDVPNPFGIIIYAAGAPPPAMPKTGIGPRQWIEGLWLYDDGQLDQFGQSALTGNRGTPVNH